MVPDRSEFVEARALFLLRLGVGDYTIADFDLTWKHTRKMLREMRTPEPAYIDDYCYHQALLAALERCAAVSTGAAPLWWENEGRAQMQAATALHRGGWVRRLWRAVRVIVATRTQ